MAKLLNCIEFPLPWMVGAADGADGSYSSRVGRDLLEMRWLRALGSLVDLTEDPSDIGGPRLGDGRFTCAGKAGL